MDTMHAHNDLSMMQGNRNVNVNLNLTAGAGGWDMTPIVTLPMLQCQMCAQNFSTSGKLSDHRTPVLCVNPSNSIEGPYCIACAGKRDGLRSFQIDDARVALVKLWHQQMTLEATVLQHYQQQHQHIQQLESPAMAAPVSAAAADITRRMAAKQDAPGLITGNPKARRASLDYGMAGSTEDTTVGVSSSVGDHEPTFAGMKHVPAAPTSSANTNTTTNNTSTTTNTNKRSKFTGLGYSKTTWTDEEDAILTEAVTTSTEQPFTRWSDLAHQLPGRVGKQIRDRWLNHLDPKIDRSPFTKEEDYKLYEAYKKHGKRWVEISTKFFDSRRSENHVKNRWYSAAFKKFVRQEFGEDPFLAEANTKQQASHKRPFEETTSDEYAEEKKEEA
jgi:Myb-like DNA-binding domain